MQMNKKSKIGSTVFKFQEKWATVEETVWSIMFVAMMIMMFVQVSSRFVFKISVPWTEEFIRYSFIAGAYIAVGANIIKEGHIEINILASFFAKAKKVQTRERLAQANDIIRFAVVAIGAVYMLNIEVSYVFKQMSINAMSAAMHIPMWIMYALISYGYLSLLIQCILKIFISLTDHNLIIDKTLLPKEGSEEACMQS